MLSLCRTPSERALLDPGVLPGAQTSFLLVSDRTSRVFLVFRIQGLLTQTKAVELRNRLLLLYVRLIPVLR